MKYLIVDDEEVSRKSLTWFLEQKRNSCKTAANAKTALSILEKETFDIVITDFKMHGMNGVDLLKRIRKNFPNMIVIIITGYAEVENATDALNWGAKGFFQKPLDTQKLNMLLNIAESERAKLRANIASFKSYIFENIAFQYNWSCFKNPITGLSDWKQFLEHLTNKIGGKERLAVITINLENFDFLNNSLGFNMANKLVQVTAERIKESIKTEHILSQIRNDSFAILLPYINSTDEAILLAKLLLKVMKRAVSLEGKELFAKTAIGIGVYPQHGEEAECLLKNVNTALQYAKKREKEKIQVYSQELNKKNNRRLTIESSIRSALDRNEFSLHYQPQIDLLNERIFGLEALIRWHHSIMGTIPPDEFIPIAEETGLIDLIGNWVIKTACKQIKEFHREGILLDKVSVNISAHQLLGDSLYETVDHSLGETGIKPGCMELELTETVLMEDIEQAITNLNKIKSLNVNVSLDDFGKGYSSLSYLKDLPIDTLKVDRSFVNSILSNSHDATIMKAVINIAHNANFKIIAEGVENSKQLSWLKKNKCDAVQGYYFSKPLTADEFEKFYYSTKNIKKNSSQESLNE